MAGLTVPYLLREVAFNTSLFQILLVLVCRKYLSIRRYDQTPLFGNVSGKSDFGINRTSSVAQGFY